MNESIHENMSRTDGLLQIQTLGDFSVQYSETNLTNSFENSQKLLELFIYFITYRNELILSEKIIDELWPESDFSDPKRTLRALIFRLRKTLSQYDTDGGSSIITYSNGCYKFNAHGFCSIDIEEFELTYKQAMSLYNKSRSEAMRLYERVIQMYNGGYLKKTALLDWLIPIKNHYHHIFVQSCNKVIDYLADEGRNQEIIKMSDQIMRHDLYSEHIHLHYIESLTKLGEIKHAKSHIKYIQRIFDRELGFTSSEFISRMNDLINHNTLNHPVKLEYRSNVSQLVHDSKGPIFCDYVFFELYQKIELQRNERLGKNLFWGTISIIDYETIVQDEKKTLDAMEMLRVILVSNLRKGDVISQSKETQFSISFSTDDLRRAEKAFERIQKKFLIASISNQISIITELFQYPI